MTSTIRETAARSADFMTLSKSCSQVVKDIYIQQFSHILRTNPVIFDQQIMGGQLSIVFSNIYLFGIENSKPVLIDITFYMNKGVRNPVVITSNIGKQPMAVISSGRHHSHKGIVGQFESGGPVAELKKMIGYETDGAVDGSGPPIDILVMTGNVAFDEGYE